jgi:thiazole synthase
MKRKSGGEAMEREGKAQDAWSVGGHRFSSRLLMGTGKFQDAETMALAVLASRAQIVTVALRRVCRAPREDDMLGPLRQLGGVTLMPNTSGARNAAEAIRAARLGRELSGSPFVKVEIHPNPRHLMPDPIETFEAARVLAAEGFVVMPYMPADPVLARRLEDVGCASLMPLGSAIGSGRGLATAEMLRLILRDARIPVIVDAGLRSPSEAAAALEMGCDAVLVNSAVAASGDPVAMAGAFAQAVEAGRVAHRAGLMTRGGGTALPTSPLTAFLSGEEA